MIYLDNNATTVMSPETIAEMVSWCNRGNPSAGYASAKESRAMMERLRLYLGKLCKFDACCKETRDGGNSDPANNGDVYANDIINGDGSVIAQNAAKTRQREVENAYDVIFTSGASEANCTVLRGVLDAYLEQHGIIPHVIMSAIEHKSLLTMAESYEQRGLAEVSWIAPTRSGHIRPEDIAAALLPHTCLICVMHANNETGAINDIHAIGELAWHAGVPFHCDTVQSFGKHPVNLAQDRIDSFCISFHKLGGPPGCGALIIKKSLAFTPLIAGTQNMGLRGGTENLPGLGASLHALAACMLDREAKNARIWGLKKYIMDSFNAVQYTKYNSGDYANSTAKVCYLSGQSQYYLENTILLSVIKRTEPYVCNTKIKEYLEAYGIVVSVGSACNTASAKASHVLYAMGADEYIRKGAIRVSLGDLTTLSDVKKFVDIFRKAAAAQSVII